MSTLRRNEGEPCKVFLERLSHENREFYESDRGKGALKDLQQKFPHAWLYVAELIQNAVDEKATVIRLEIIDEKTLVIEHNGEEFDFDKDVIGLCTKGVSSKGAGTVGFMGIGFKAVFRSYETVRISSGEWKFSLQVDISIGKEYGNQSRNWLGAVLPKWDSLISEPSEGMTCRFELTDRVIRNHTIESDLHAVFKDDKALLPLLARQGVTELDWNGEIWLLTIVQSSPFEDNSGHRIHLKAARDIDKEVCQWMVFSQKYTPSRDAIRKFLEHRQLSAPTPEEEKKIYFDASRTRKVEAFFEINEDLIPLLPNFGEAYALLPTSVKLPIGINIQADWLLTQSRQELMDADLKDNPWHREIIENIPKITKHYFDWIVRKDDPLSCIREGTYKILPSLDQGSIDTYGWFLGNGASHNDPSKLEYCKLLCEQLADLEFIAQHTSEDKINFISPQIARVLPEKLAIQCGDKLELIPWIIFGNNIASRSLIGVKAVDTLTKVGLLNEIKSQELAEYWGEELVKSWYENFDDAIRYQRLESLIHGLFEMDERDDWKKASLKCIPSENGEFIARQTAIRHPSDWNIIVGNPEFVSALKPFIEDQGDIVSWKFDRVVMSRQQHRKTKARDYIDTINQADLAEIVADWWSSFKDTDDLNTDLISRFTAYIFEKNPSRKKLIKKVICLTDDQNEVLCDLNEALLAEPYARDYRKLFYPEYLKVANCYYITNDALNWRALFESCDPPTIGRFIPQTINNKLTPSEFIKLYPNDNSILRASRITPILWRRDENITVGNHLFYLIDYKFNDRISNMLLSGEVDQTFSDWLSEDTEHLRVHTHKYLLYIPFKEGSIKEEEKPETTDWINKLNIGKWIFSKKNTGPYKPEEVLKTFDPARPDAPVADLSHDLVQLLEIANIRFGTRIPKAGPMQKLQAQGGDLSTIGLSEVIEEIVNEGDPEDIEPLIRLLDSKLLIPVPDGTKLLDGSKRVSFSRIVKKAGPGFRSSLGWVIAVSDIKSDATILNIFELLRDIYEFPAKTSANQSIDFLEWLWRQRPDAELVRRFLPFAYAYINEEISHNVEIKYRWKNALSTAMVYTLGRQWTPVIGSDTIYFDDLQIVNYKLVPKRQLVTPTHLASTDRSENQLAAARLLEISLLSDDYKIKSEEGVSLPTPTSWLNNFTKLQKVVIEVLKISDDYDDNEGEKINEDSDKKQNLGLKILAGLSQKILRLSDNNILYTRQVYALQKGNNALVCGEPSDFSSELCYLLISYYNANRKKDSSFLATEITRLIFLIDRSDFSAQLDKFKKKFGIETLTDQTLDQTILSTNISSEDTQNEQTSIDNSSGPPEENITQKHKTFDEINALDESDKNSSNQAPKEVKDPGSSGTNSKTDGNNRHGTGSSGRNGDFKDRNFSEKFGGSEDAPPINPGQSKSNSTHGHDKSTKKANRLLSYVIGETAASNDNYQIFDDESPKNIEVGAAAEFIVMQYEKRRGWNPVNMNDVSVNHQGYDLESVGPDGRVIYIEVKGINGPWTNVGVGLSPTQFKCASKFQDDYFLYVVENTLPPEASEVYRIANPAQMVTKFQFDHGWKNVALIENEKIELPETEILDYVGKRVKIVSMGNKEGSIQNVIKNGKIMLMTITFDDGAKIYKIYNQMDMKFI